MTSVNFDALASSEFITDDDTPYSVTIHMCEDTVAAYLYTPGEKQCELKGADMLEALFYALKWKKRGIDMDVVDEKLELNKEEATGRRCAPTGGEITMNTRDVFESQKQAKASLVVYYSSLEELHSTLTDADEWELCARAKDQVVRALAGICVSHDFLDEIESLKNGSGVDNAAPE